MGCLLNGLLKLGAVLAFICFEQQAVLLSELSLSVVPGLFGRGDDVIELVLAQVSTKQQLV